MKGAGALLSLGPVKYTPELVERKIRQCVIDREPFDVLMQKKVAYFQASRYEQAVEVCIQLVAQSKHVRPKPGLNAMCLHSLGSALHQLGFHKAAAVYYHRGLEAFEREAASWCDCCSKQNTQLKFMRERAEMNARGVVPEAGSYCSETGKIAYWTEQEVAQAIEKIAAFEGGNVGSESSLIEIIGNRPSHAGGVYRSFTGLLTGTTKLIDTTWSSTEQAAQKFAEVSGSMIGCASPRSMQRKGNGERTRAQQPSSQK